MPFVPPLPDATLPERRLSYVVAVALVLLATTLRLALDPLVQDQASYVFYVAAVVLSVWWGGEKAGTVAATLSIPLGDYLFVSPRYTLSFDAHHVATMASFAVVSAGLIWLVGRGRRAESRLHADMTEQVRASEVLQKQAEVLRQQAEELQAILDTVPAVVMITHDPGGLRVDGNRFAVDVMRMPPGANLSKGVPADRQPPFKTMRGSQEIPSGELPVRAAMARGAEIRDYEFDIVHPDGTRRTLFGNATPLRDAAGRTRGAVAAFVDITERKQIEESLREANRLKDEFLATLGHELRTPLNAIVGWADMLRRGSLGGADTQHATESIYRNARVQSELINDILDVSRIISGRVRLDVQPVDPAALLRRAVESLQAAADAKGVVLRTQLEAASYPVSADATRLQQVFWNLVSNGVKFTPAGGTVSVSLRFVDGYMQVLVSDTGIGIDGDFLPYVFERFRQRDSTSTRRHGGLGLGLAIVRHLVELHGGTVRADSAGEGKGATFTVTLPAQAFGERRREDRTIDRQVSAVEVAPDDLPSLCGLRVLVVDDQRDAREVASSVLRHRGADVAVAANGGQALQQFELFAPDVLLLDLAMPDMDGYELIDRIRRSGGPKGLVVPAIAFTAYAREEDERRALGSGFQLHLAKPVDAHALVRAIARLAGERWRAA